MHVTVNWVIIGSSNGLLPDRRQTITWTNADVLSIGPSRTHFHKITVDISNLPFKKILLKMLSAKCWPFNYGLKALNLHDRNHSVFQQCPFHTALWLLFFPHRGTEIQEEFPWDFIIMVHWPLGNVAVILTSIIFKLIINISSGNGLVPSGNKPLFEAMLPCFMLPYGITRPQWVNGDSEIACQKIRGLLQSMKASPNSSSIEILKTLSALDFSLICLIVLWYRILCVKSQNG